MMKIPYVGGPLDGGWVEVTYRDPLYVLKNVWIRTGADIESCFTYFLCAASASDDGPTVALMYEWRPKPDYSGQVVDFGKIRKLMIGWKEVQGVTDH